MFAPESIDSTAEADITDRCGANRTLIDTQVTCTYAGKGDTISVAGRFVQEGNPPVDEVACIAKARDPWTAKQCAPAMFPDAASHDDDRCQRIVANVRANMPNVDASVREWMKTELDVELHACIEDRWPDWLQARLTTAAFFVTECGRRPLASNGQPDQALGNELVDFSSRTRASVVAPFVLSSPGGSFDQFDFVDRNGRLRPHLFVWGALGP